MLKKKKIKILRIMRGLKLGGIELRSFQLTKALNESEEYAVDIVTLMVKGELFDEARDSGIEVFHIPIRHRTDLSGIWRLRRLIRQNKYEIVHTHSFYPNVPGRIAGVLAKAPVIIAHQHSLFSKKCKHKKHAIYERMLAPFTTVIIAVSKTVKEDYVNFTKVPADKVTVIYNGVDLSAFNRQYDVATLKAELGIANQFVIGNIARLVPVKDHITLIKAAKLVVEKFPQAVFLIVGDGLESYKQKLLSLIYELNVKNNVKLIGYRSDIPRLMQLFDIGVLSSQFEGLGSVILEFFAAGKPVVATDNGGQSEIISDGNNGFLVPTADYHSMAEKILALIENPNMCQQMGTIAQATAQKFSLENMVANIEKLYKELCLKRGLL